MDSVVQDKRLMLGQGPAEGPAVDGARDMFTYLCQYLTSLEAEVRTSSVSALPTRLLLMHRLCLLSAPCMHVP